MAARVLASSAWATRAAHASRAHRACTVRAVASQAAPCIDSRTRRRSSAPGPTGFARRGAVGAGAPARRGLASGGGEADGAGGGAGGREGAPRGPAGSAARSGGRAQAGRGPKWASAGRGAGGGDDSDEAARRFPPASLAEAGEIDELVRTDPMFADIDLHDEEGENMIPNPTGTWGGTRVWSATKLTKAELEGTEIPANPYTSKVAYSDKWSTSKDNPREHVAPVVEEAVRRAAAGDEASAMALVGAEADATGGAADAALDARRFAGLYYTLPDDYAEALFPEGLAGDLKDEFETTGVPRLMVRQPGLDLVRSMEAFRRLTEGTAEGARRWTDCASWPFSVARPFTLLTGERGAGKSAVLNYVVHYARSNGWIALFVPDAHHIMEQGLVLSKSRTRPGFIDQHDMATEMLRQTLAAHREQLARVPQRGKYGRFQFLPADADDEAIAEQERLQAADTKERRRVRAEAQAAGTPPDEVPKVVSQLREAEADTSLDRSSFTLADMAEWGLRHPPMATDTLLTLQAELTKCVEYPVLLAIDGINEYYDVELSVYPQDGLMVPVDKLSIPHGLRVLGKRGLLARAHMRRGVTVAAITNRHRHAAGKRMAKECKISGKAVVEVAPLTRYEVHNALQHYAETSRFLLVHSPEVIDANNVEYYRQLTGGNPRELYNCSMFV